MSVVVPKPKEGNKHAGDENTKEVEPSDDPKEDIEYFLTAHHIKTNESTVRPQNVILKRPTINERRYSNRKAIYKQAARDQCRRYASDVRIRVKSQEALGLKRKPIVCLQRMQDLRAGTKENIQTVVKKPNCELCRLCGKIIHAKLAVNIFNEKQGKVVEKARLLRLINFHLDVWIKEDDNLSHFVCITCRTYVRQWATYYRECLAMQKLMITTKNENSEAEETPSPTGRELIETKKNDRSNDYETETDHQIDVSLVKVEAPPPGEEEEDDIERLLAQIHGIKSETNTEPQLVTPDSHHDVHDDNQQNDDHDHDNSIDSVTQDSQNMEDFDMNVEYLDEERELVDEALLYQNNHEQGTKGQQTSNSEPENLLARYFEAVEQDESNKENEPSKVINVKQESNGTKIIRSSRKLPELDLRIMLDKLGFGELSVVTILKSSRSENLDIQKYTKELKDELSTAKEASILDGNMNNYYYNMLAKSYAHNVLEHIQADSEMFFRCPYCKTYLPSNELPRHIVTEHRKRVALCDFCKLILPYDTEENKVLVKEHIALHDANKLESHYEVILNVCKLLECISIESNDKTDGFSNNEKPDGSGKTVNLSSKLKASKNRFRCNKCSAKFTTSQKVRDHVRLHRPEKLVCEECNNVFASQFDLQNHIKDDHGSAAGVLRWLCTECNVEFLNKFAYQDHLNNKHNKSAVTAPTSRWLCEYCNLEFTDEAVYDEHIKNKQSLHVSEFYCPHCTEICSSKEHLEKHSIEHKAPTYICDTCGSAFTKTIELEKHVETMHADKNSYTCEQCQYKNFSLVGLRNHMRMHHPDVKKESQLPSGSVFFCEYNNCELSFPSVYRLKDHMKKKHQTTHNFSCPLCDWSYNHLVNLKKHFDVHIEKGHTNCKVCNQSFEINGEKLEIQDVVAHKEKHTEEENSIYQRPYSPSVSRMTPWRDSVTAQASGARMFCRDCGVACSIPLELRKHQKTHKPFYCSTCQTVSLNAQTFVLHMEQHADRKHICKTCGKRFMTINALNLHSRVHASSPKFSCAVCSRLFRIATDWKRHERTCRNLHNQVSTTFSQARANETTEKNVRRRIRVKPATKKVQKPEEVVDGAVEQDIAENTRFFNILEDGQTVTYEYIEEESLDQYEEQEKNLKEEESYIEYVVQDEESGDAIEIDESQLVEFQQWKSSGTNAAGVKSEIINYNEDDVENETELLRIDNVEEGNADGDTNSTASVYYSIEELPGNKKQYRFIPQYVIQQGAENEEELENVDENPDEESSQDQKYIRLQTSSNTENITTPKYIIPNEHNINDSNSVVVNINENNEDEVNETEDGDIVYTISNADNMVYNIEDSISLAQAANIIFEDPNEDENEPQDGSNISYVFDNSPNSNVTIFLKNNEGYATETDS